jgi:hypothetical protein
MMDNASALPHMPTATTTKDSSSKMAKDHPHDFTKRHNKIDPVNIQKLGIDQWNFARRALVIVIDELHGSTKHSSFRVRVLFPDALREQRRFAICRETAGQ